MVNVGDDLDQRTLFRWSAVERSVDFLTMYSCCKGLSDHRCELNKFTLL